MKVRLEDIPPEGLQVEFGDQAARPADLGEVVEEVLGAPRAEGLLERRGELVIFRGRFDARVKLACSRCLAPVEMDLEGPISVTFRPQPAPGKEEVRLEDDELDVIFYAGAEVDLGAALRDEVGLALPMAPVCAENCRGICPRCGKPAGQCACREKDVDPRLAKLAELKLN